MKKRNKKLVTLKKKDRVNFLWIIRFFFFRICLELAEVYIIREIDDQKWWIEKITYFQKSFRKDKILILKNFTSRRPDFSTSLTS